MPDTESLTKARVEEVIKEVAARRVTDGFLAEVSKPGNLDWLTRLIEQSFDRVEGKTRGPKERSYVQT